MIKEQSALDTQIEGNHYKELKMQPIELAYKVNGSPCFTKLAKYASRKKVDRLGDLKKAIHCIQLEQELSLLVDNRYQGIKVSDKFFHKTLKEFTSSPFLFSALYAMYYGEYNEASCWVQSIIREEFPDEA